MATHMEFVVAGPPISNQQSTPTGRANLAAWRTKIRGVAQTLWSNPAPSGELKVIILNFYVGKEPSVDLDNMSKPILDAMQSLVYDDDRQVTQGEIAHLRVGGAYTIAGVSDVVVLAIRAGAEFVYIRIEDPVVPYSLPR
jgi:Holliday junction resolvase RusA-like endonuclease